MQNADSRVQAIQSRLKSARDAAAQLEDTIVDRQVSDSLLRLAKNQLDDVDRLLVPNGLKADNSANAAMWFGAAESQLHNAEEQVRRVKDLVAKYGRNLKLIG